MWPRPWAGPEMGRESEVLGFRGGGVLPPEAGAQGGRAVLTCGLEPVLRTSCQKRVTSGQAGDKGKPMIQTSAAQTLWPGCCPGNATWETELPGRQLTLRPVPDHSLGLPFYEVGVWRPSSWRGGGPSSALSIRALAALGRLCGERGAWIPCRGLMGYSPTCCTRSDPLGPGD